MLHRVSAGACAVLVVATLAACGEGGYRAGVSSYARTTDPRTIVVYLTTGPCDTLDRTEAKETASTVIVGVWVRQAEAGKPCPSIAETERAVNVRLAKPLGARTVQGAPDTPPIVERTTPTAR